MEAPLPVRHCGRVSNDPFERIIGQSRAAEAIRTFGRRAATVAEARAMLGLKERATVGANA